MQTTINLDENLLGEARRVTGVSEQTALIHAGLRALIGSEDARRIGCIAGTPNLQKPVRQPGSARGLLKILSEDKEHLVDFQDYMS